MYERFFGLSDRPFAAAPCANRYFPAAAAENARETIGRAIDRAAGPALLIGPSGTGKSVLCQVLAEQHKDNFDVVMLVAARLCTRRALLQAILYNLGLPYREREEGELRLALIDYLAPGPSKKDGVLILADEAQLLPLRLLEELRMITNFVRDGKARVRLVLAGSPSLEERFASPKLESFNQRIAARCYLDGFTRDETMAYVRAEIRACGGDVEGIFTQDALAAVHRATDGVPRLIGQVCDHALILAAAGGERRICAEGIEEAWSDLQQLPIPFKKIGKDAANVDAGIVEFGSLEDSIDDGTFDPIEEMPESVPFIRINRDEAEKEAYTLDEPFSNAVLDGPETFESGVGETKSDAEGRMDQIQRHLEEVESSVFHSEQMIRGSLESNFHEKSLNPFAQSFEDEELVLDPHASLDEAYFRGTPRVYDQSGEQLAQHLRALSNPLDVASAERFETIDSIEKNNDIENVDEVVACEIKGDIAQSQGIVSEMQDNLTSGPTRQNNPYPAVVDKPANLDSKIDPHKSFPTPAAQHGERVFGRLFTTLRRK